MGSIPYSDRPLTPEEAEFVSIKSERAPTPYRHQTWRAAVRDHNRVILEEQYSYWDKDPEEVRWMHLARHGN